MQEPPAFDLASPVFPAAGFGPGRPWRHAGTFGRAYVDVPEALAAAAPGWLAAEQVPGAVELKRGVYRLGELVVKLFEPPRALNWLRPPMAVRSAERHFQSLPLPSPRPALALAARRRGPSLLVREYAAGLVLREAWERSPDAVEKLPEFLGAMSALGLRHGDLHPRNLLWDGRRWILLDVDGLRHRLHPAGRVRLGLWVKLFERLPDEERLYAVFRRALEASNGRDKTDWNEVVRLGRMGIAERAARGRTP